MILSDAMIILLQKHINEGGTIQTWLATYNQKADPKTVGSINKQLEEFKRKSAALTRRESSNNVKSNNVKSNNVSDSNINEAHNANANTKMPSPIQQVKNLANFAKDAAKEAIKTGNIKSTETQADKRFEICKKCPHFNPQNNRCKLCGCFMKTKVKYSAAKCPDKPPRWK